MPPSVEEMRVAIERLVAAVTPEAVLAHQPFPTPTAWAYGYGWHRTVVGAVNATLTLVDAALAHESAANRRSMIEHAGFVEFLAQEPEGVVELANQRYQYLIQKMDKSLTEAGYDEVEPEWREWLKTELPKSKLGHLGEASQFLPHIGLTVLVPMWRSDSLLAHPSVLSTKSWWEENDDGTATFFMEPRAESTSPGIVSACLTCLAGATGAFNSLTPDQPWTDDVATAVAVLHSD